MLVAEWPPPPRLSSWQNTTGEPVLTSNTGRTGNSFPRDFREQIVSQKLFSLSSGRALSPKEMNDALKTRSYKENRVGGGEATQTNGKGDYYGVENALWGWSLHTGRYFGGHKSESVPFLLLKRRRRKNKRRDFSEPPRNLLPLQQSHCGMWDWQNHSATFPQDVGLHRHAVPGLLTGSSRSARNSSGMLRS